MSQGNPSDYERQVDDYIARKSRFVPAREFEGNGKVLLFNTSRVKLNPQGKFGEVIEYTVKEIGSGIERVVNASAISLISGLRLRLKEKPQGADVALHVRKTGTGTDTKYIIEHANAN